MLSLYVAQVLMSDFEMVLVTSFISGITFALTFHMCRISVVRPLYFKIFTLFLITLLLSSSFLNTFMHGIYNYIPEINHVCRVYSVPAVLYLQFVLHVKLFHP